MKIKNIFRIVFPLIIVLVVLFGYFLFIILLEPCNADGWPIPPPRTIRFESLHLVTDQGPLYLGQTYNHRNEGPWVGSLTLLLITKNSAVLLIRDPEGTGTDWHVSNCKMFYPRPTNLNLFSDGSTTYTYDSHNWLKTVTTGAVVYEYTCNGLVDRR